VTIFTAAAAFGDLTVGRPAHAAAAVRAAASTAASSSTGVCANDDAANNNGDANNDTSGPRWRVRRTLGDGSCLFRAVVQGAALADAGEGIPPESEARAARTLRLRTVQALRDHRADVEPFLPGIAPDFDAYCADMSREGAWGGEPELAMAAQHVLRRPLAVYSARLGDRIARAGGPDGTGLPAPVVTYGEQFAGDPSAPHVVRLLWSGNHYETLVDEHRSRRMLRRAKGGNGGGSSSGDGSSGGSSGSGSAGGGRSCGPRSRL